MSITPTPIAAGQRNSQRTRAQPEQDSLCLPHSFSLTHTLPPTCPHLLLLSHLCPPVLLPRASCPEGAHILPRHRFRTGQEGTGTEERERPKQQRRSVKKEAKEKGALKPMTSRGRSNEWELFNLQTFSDRMKEQIH